MNLGELIQAYRGDASYTRLAKRANDAGYPISGQMIHHLVSKPVESIPRVNTIHALAAALGVAPRAVLDAAAESVGLAPTPHDELTNVTNRSQVQALLAVVGHRPPDEVEQLSRVVRTVAEALDARADASATASVPDNTAGDDPT